MIVRELMSILLECDMDAKVNVCARKEFDDGKIENFCGKDISIKNYDECNEIEIEVEAD